MESQLSIDHRVERVPVPLSRDIVLIEDLATYQFPTAGFQGAFVWARPGKLSDLQIEQFKKNAKFAGASTVHILPREAEDAPLPTDAGADLAPLSDVSEVRPVVAELVSELAEGLRVPVAEYIETLFANVRL
jgi:hypothetical protein